MTSQTNTRRKKRIKKMIKIIIPIALIAFIIFRLLFEKDMLQYKRYTVENPDIPDSFDGFKIIQLTDLHFHSNINYDLMDEMVEKINKESPDIIVLTGDYVDKSVEFVVSVVKVIERLEATYGIYAVMGNHDWWNRYTPLIEGFEDIGVKILENDHTTIDIDGQSIYLCGIADFDTNYPDLDMAVEDAKDEDYVILLSHNPYVAEVLDDHPIDLIFSGHTHGGQITLFGLYAPILPNDMPQDLASGLTKRGDTDIIVSNGIGTTFTNIRFFARPQVVITTLSAK